MAVHVVIPARFGSKRFPGKQLALIDDRPMILHVWDRLQIGDWDVTVATDSPEIASVVENAGGNVVITEGSFQSGTDRVAYVAKQYPPDDIIVNVQGDLPRVEPKVVEQLVLDIENWRADITTPVVRRDHDKGICEPGAVKVRLDRQCRALMFTRAAVKAGPDYWYQHIGIYAYRNFALQRWSSLPPAPLEELENLEQLRPLYWGQLIHCVHVTPDWDCSPDVNYPEDLKELNKQ